MSNRNLGLLALITVVGIAIAAVVSYYRAPETSTKEQSLYPHLSSKINTIKELDIKGKGRTVTLLKQGDHWVIRQADGYPAKFDKIRETLLGIANLRIVADKTSNPALYSRLGVEDPNKKQANSLLVTALDNSNNPLISLIVGKHRRTPVASTAPGMYVRKAGVAQSLLVNGDLAISSDITDWFNRNLMDIHDERIKDILVQHADGSSVHLHREKGTDDFTLDDIPKGEQAQSVTVNRMGTVLQDFFVDGVRSDSKLAFPAKTDLATITTFGGMTAKVTSAEVDNMNYARFSFSYSAPPPTAKQQDPKSNDKTAEKPQQKKRDVEAEVQKLNKAVQGWSFEIPDFKYKLLNTSLDELIRKTPPPKKTEKSPGTGSARPPKPHRAGAH